jgi:hypothetical protein
MKEEDIFGSEIVVCQYHYDDARDLGFRYCDGTDSGVGECAVCGGRAGMPGFSLFSRWVRDGGNGHM